MESMNIPLGGGEVNDLTATPGRSPAYEKLIKVWQGSIRANNLEPSLWVKKREEWEETKEKDESEDAPFDPQLLAALQCFSYLYGRKAMCAWVHLAAEMQGGKSGVANALIRIVLQNAKTLQVKPNQIFVLTGMSDDAWKKQTKSRVPKEVRHNVHHSGGLKKVQKQLMTLAANDGLRDVLVILDESQVASTAGNRPNTMVYNTIRSLVPPSKWVEHNIRFLTISATDPGKVMSMEGCEVPARTIQLLTTPAYQSVETLYAEKRVRALETHGDLTSAKAIAELQRAVVEYDAPLWHILRPRMGKTAEVEAKLREKFPSARVVMWDSKSAKQEGGSEMGSESTESLEDINELLASPPETHSFVLLKNMFYASKTLDDKHVGILWDRLGGSVGADNARLQSLLGRACGYGKSKRTVVYTSIDTVKRYVDFWRELCRSVEAPTVTTEYKAEVLNRRMPGVVAMPTEAGAKVAPVHKFANPVASSSSNAVAAGAGRVNLSEDAFSVEWKEFATFAEAKAYAPYVHEPKTVDADGFLLSSTTGKSARLSQADVAAMRGGKVTAGFGNAKKLAVGKSTSTLYVYYRNLQDIASVVYVVGKLTRNA